MRITRKDLPKSIADAYEAKLEEFGSPIPTKTSESAALDAAQNARKLVQESGGDGLVLALSFFVLLLDTASLVGLFFAWVVFGVLVALLLFLLAVGLNVGFIGWYKRREQRYRYHPALLRAVLPLVFQTDTEKVYVRTLLRLVEQETVLGKVSSRSLLSQLKTLLESSDEIARQQQDIKAAIGEQSRTEVNSMRDALALRVSEARDSEARETLRQALALSEARLQRAIALDPLGERLEAQQEMIRQTLSSVQESLVTIQNQTLAVEQAVQEVMASRAF